MNSTSTSLLTIFWWVKSGKTTETRHWIHSHTLGLSVYLSDAQTENTHNQVFTRLSHPREKTEPDSNDKIISVFKFICV